MVTVILHILELRMLKDQTDACFITGLVPGRISLSPLRPNTRKLIKTKSTERIPDY